jgi:hypothetical protein
MSLKKILNHSTFWNFIQNLVEKVHILENEMFMQRELHHKLEEQIQSIEQYKQEKIRMIKMYK